MEIDLTQSDLDDSPLPSPKLMNRDLDDSPLPSPKLMNRDLDDSPLPSPKLMKREMCINISSDSDTESITLTCTTTKLTPEGPKLEKRRAHSISSSDELDKEILNCNDINDDDHDAVFLPLSARLGIDISAIGKKYPVINTEPVFRTNEHDNSDTKMDRQQPLHNGTTDENTAPVHHDFSSDTNDSTGSQPSLINSHSDDNLQKDDSDVENITDKHKTKTKKSTAKALTKELKERRREELQQARALKSAARLEKQLAKEKEKLLKKLEAEKLKNSRPGECLKNIIVLMDPRFLDLPEGPILLGLLQSQEIPYRTFSQPVPCCITWTRQQMETRLNENNEVEKNIRESEEHKVIVSLPLEEFLQLVDNFKKAQMGLGSGETLTDYVDTLKVKFPQKNITLLVKGCEQYFRNEKNKHQRDHRKNILGYDESQAKKAKRKKPRTELPSLSELDVEECVIALQISRDCGIVMMESTADIAFSIIAYSKALAVAPYKQEKAKNEAFLWMTNNTKLNPVSDSGEGLLSVWQKQIQQFHAANEEAAQAIASLYPSPLALMRAFKNEDTRQAEKLLQDIEVRRGAGPLASSRRIGPVLSRKLFHLLTSLNPELNLNAT